MSPAISQQGWVQTWVTSQWKNRPIPGQFSAEINNIRPNSTTASAPQVGLHAAIVAGDIVLSGSFVRPLECRSGDRIAADFGLFGAVTLGFA
jgi:hypothetical protein